MAESNETMVSLAQAKDLYSTLIDVKTCESLIDTYDKISRQCYNLAVAWDRFGERRPGMRPISDKRNEQGGKGSGDSAAPVE